MEHSSLIPVVKWIKNGFASSMPIKLQDNTHSVKKQQVKDPNFELEGYDQEDSSLTRYSCICSRRTRDEL